jgi:hypothetical protein
MFGVSYTSWFTSQFFSRLEFMFWCMASWSICLCKCFI